MPSKSRINWIFCVPSFWGLLTWTSTSILYIAGPIAWQNPGTTGYLILCTMGLAFATSLLIHSPLYKKVIYSPIRRVPSLGTAPLIGLHMLGFLGPILFVYDIESTSQLSSSFIQTLLQDPLSIRKINLEGIERGMYLGYIGWLASLLTGARIANELPNRKFLLLLVVLQTLANLVFLSKVRPLAIVILTIFGYLLAIRKTISLKQAFLNLLLVALTFSAIFVIWSTATGKVWSQATDLHPALETLLLYLTVGYPYLLNIVEVEIGDGSFPSRVLRPAFTLASIFFGTSPPPSSILPFYELPYGTNVGTALEPFYRDAGLIGLCIGFFTLSFVVDYLALIAMRHGRIAGFCLAVVLCMSSASAFFAPRIGTGPVFLALLLFMVSKLFFYIRSVRSKASDPGGSA